MPLPNTWPWHCNTSAPLRSPPTVPQPTATPPTSPTDARSITPAPPSMPTASTPSANSSATSLIHRVVHALWNPQRQRYLLTLRDGIPQWTESAAQAATWFTEDGAIRIARLINCQTIPVPVHYVRPAADPLNWRVADD